MKRRQRLSTLLRRNGTSRGRRSSLPLLVIGLLLAGGLPACHQVESGLQRIPTARPTHTGQTETTQEAASLPTAEAPPEEMGTAPPIVALPDATGLSVACETNTLRVMPVTPEGEHPGTLSAVEAYGEYLYLLADGGLFRIALEAIEAETLEMTPLIMPGERIAGRPVQELIRLAIDGSQGTLYALDKAGHVFRYEIASGLKMLSYRAKTDPDEALDRQITSLTVNDRGQPVLLDTAHGALLTPAGIGTLETVNESRGLTSGADLAFSGGRYFILTNNGIVRAVSAEVGSAAWRATELPGLGLAIKVSDHLGIDILYLVDGLKREVTGILPQGGSQDGETVTRLVFAFADMGLLRDVVFGGERLYAIADGDLFLYPGPDTGGEAACQVAAPTEGSGPPLYGTDVLAAFKGARLPVDGGWTLPPWPRVYPGASRLYRAGVHQGLDFYGYTGPENFQIGWPVVAVQSGTVVRANIGYKGVDEELFEAMLAESEAEGATPPDVLERLSGRQVIIEHADGVRTVYSHLDEIAPGVVTGAHVQAGQIIGTVGVTGTLGEIKPGSVGPHLHFEIWVNDHYLGYSISIREVMWWYEQIFTGGLTG